MADPSSRYDVFLSYNWRDHALVESVARAMREQGINVFLDRWYLAAGRPWPGVLEEALGACRAVAIFLGTHPMGHWQQREKDLALERQAIDPTFPLIPVLLPGADPALGFLSLNTWVDLRNGLSDPLAMEVLTAAVRGGMPPAQMLVSGLHPPSPASALTGACMPSGKRTHPSFSAGTNL